MDFFNTFSVRAPQQAVWEFLLDVYEVAPCVSGAEILEELGADHYKGAVTVKLGPAQVSYRGELQVERDSDGRAITLRAKGAGLRGMGRATATIIARLSENDGETRVDVNSQVDVAGRVAQFGRGIIKDVATRQNTRFAACLESKLLARNT